MREIMWAKGFRAKADAKEVYLELEEIRAENGDIVAAEVVKKAKEKTSAMHEQFQWNDEEAAEKFRLEQARLLVRSIHVIYKQAPKAAVRLYSNVVIESKSEPPKTEKVYIRTEDALKDPVLKAGILGDAIRDAISFRRKYAHLQELSKVFVAIDKFVVNA